MLETHSVNALCADYASQKRISVCTLDGICMPASKHSDSIWLKIDTQGAETEVIKGATGLMTHVSALEFEL
jgi:FkbM family methyltransferase